MQCGLGSFISNLKSTASQIVVAADLEEVDFTGCGPRSVRVVDRHHEYGGQLNSMVMEHFQQVNHSLQGQNQSPLDNLTRASTMP